VVNCKAGYPSVSFNAHAHAKVEPYI